MRRGVLRSRARARARGGWRSLVNLVDAENDASGRTFRSASEREPLLLEPPARGRLHLEAQPLVVILSVARVGRRWQLVEQAVDLAQRE